MKNTYALIIALTMILAAAPLPSPLTRQISNGIVPANVFKLKFQTHCLDTSPAKTLLTMTVVNKDGSFDYLTFRTEGEAWGYATQPRFYGKFLVWNRQGFVIGPGMIIPQSLLCASHKGKTK